MLKATLLMDDQPSNEFESEHGLSIFIEKDDFSILFDTGQTNKFMINANKLGVNFSNLNACIISHGHYDHANGLLPFIKENSLQHLYVGEGFFNKKYKLLPNGDYIYRGMPYDEKDLKDINTTFITESKTEIYDDVFIVKNFPRNTEYEIDNPIFVLKDGEEYKVDHFDDEIALVIKSCSKLYVFIGCSHPGVINMINWIKELFTEDIAMVYGGIHLKNSTEKKIDSTLSDLASLQIPYFHLIHCTGDNVTDLIKKNRILSNRKVKIGEKLGV